MQLTREQLAGAMPNLARRPRLVDAYLPLVIDAMAEADVTTPERIAAFLAQVGHESGDFRDLQEIWGPTADQRRYGRRADLGNTKPEAIAAAEARGVEVGRFYKGHGAIQTTGYSNHRAAGEALGVDAVNHPELLATPEYAFRAAGFFWRVHKLNRFADSGDFLELTRRINGGTNGLADRKARWERAKRALRENPEPAPDESPAPAADAAPDAGGPMPAAPAAPVTPPDETPTANKQSLITKVGGWAVGSTGLGTVVGWFSQLASLAPSTQMLIVGAIIAFGMLGAWIAWKDHAQTKSIKADPALRDVK